ncbi:MAG: DUF4826 family protein [Romboutsia sp.]|nr:DUF4826 family protein [Romboutsia sp.]
MNNQNWIKEEWNKSTKLFNNSKKEGIICISKEPAIAFENRFVIFYAMDLLVEPKKEFWIISGDLPSSIIDAKNISDEKEAIYEFGKVYIHDGGIIESYSNEGFKLPDCVIGDRKNDKEYGKYLCNLGNYLCEFSKSFNWDGYGINGKVFSNK